MQLRYCGLMYYNLIALYPLNVLPRALCTHCARRLTHARHSRTMRVTASWCRERLTRSPRIKHPPLKTPLRLLTRRR